MASNKLDKIFDNKSELYYQHYNAKKGIYSVEKRVRMALTVSCILKHIDANKKIDIIDVGCGVSTLFFELLKSTDRFNYFGIDISQGMLSQAKKSFESIIFSNSYELFSDTSKLKSSQKGNFVVSLGVIGYQPDQKNFLQYLCDRLSNDKGSRIIMTLGNGASFIRRIRDWLKLKLKPNGITYLSTNMRTLDNTLSEYNLCVDEKRYLLPVFGLLPSTYSGASIFIQNLYLTQLLIVKHK